MIIAFETRTGKLGGDNEEKAMTASTKSEGLPRLVATKAMPTVSQAKFAAAFGARPIAVAPTSPDYALQLITELKRRGDQD